MVESPQTPETQEDPKSEFIAKLERLWDRGNFVCVGLDSDWELIPQHLKKLGRREGQFRFNKEIIDSTHELVCAYKPNIAFYEDDSEGQLALRKTVDYIHYNYPDIPVIGDIKRADIGNTNRGYVQAAFYLYQFDAATINPYLGKEALAPFLARKDKGIIVLVKTSNPGAGEFQDLPVGDTKDPLYQVVARNVAKYWNDNGNCAIVVGATYSRELGEVRAIVGDMPILIPGIGAQGGEVETTVTAGKDSRGRGMIVNSSRGIIFASKGEDFAEAARNATENLREEINKYR